MPMIASVFYNRLAIGMLLQTDPTVQYALGKTKPILTYQDLKIDSPYNTYKHPGLPPTPISNPGLAALKAAADPAAVKYLYYVARNDGLLRDGRPALEPQDSREHAFVHLGVLGESRFLRMLGDDAVERLHVLQCAAHQQRVGHAVTVVGEHPDPGGRVGHGQGRAFRHRQPRRAPGRQGFFFLIFARARAVFRTR